MYRFLIRWVKDNAGLLALLVIVSATYVPGLGGTFVVDDLFILKDNPYLNGNHIAHFFSHGFWENTTDDGNAAAIYRPLVLLYFWALHKLWGIEPFGYHAALLFIHLANTSLVYVVARRIFSSSAMAATIGAAIFALHPLGVESVAWISGVPDPLAAFFLLAALLAHHSYANGAKEWRYLVLAAASFQLALWCKEVAIIFPLVALAYDLIVMKKPNWAASTSLYIGLAVGYLIMRGLVLGKTGEWANINLMQFSRVLDLALGYSELLIFPTQVPFYLQPPRHQISTVLGWGGAALMVLAIVGAWRMFDSGRKKLLALSFVWMSGFSWSAFLMLFYLEGFYSARFLYVPVIGMALFVALFYDWVCDKHAGFKISAIVICAMLIAAAGVVTSQEIPSWHDEESIYRKVVKLAPDGSAGFQNLGFYYAMHNDLEQGEYYLKEAVRIDPMNSAAWTGLGNLAWMRGNLSDSAPLYEKALAVQPLNHEAATNLASVYEQTGQPDRAALIRNSIRK